MIGTGRVIESGATDDGKSMFMMRAAYLERVKAPCVWMHLYKKHHTDILVEKDSNDELIMNTELATFFKDGCADDSISIRVDDVTYIVSFKQLQRWGLKRCRELNKHSHRYNYNHHTSAEELLAQWIHEYLNK